MAESILWDDTFLVGLEEIDKQHKELFDLYNGLLSAHEAGDETIVSHAFEEMANYLDQHFSTEEEFWRRDDTIYHAHRTLHFDFVKYVLHTTASGSDLAALGSLLDFLSGWLLDHVLTVDKVQFQELRDKGLL